MIAVGGLTSPVKGPYAEPLTVPDEPPDSAEPLDKSCCEDEEERKYSTVTTAKKTKQLGDDNEERVESKHCPMVLPIMLMSEPDHKKNKLSGVPELELRKLERGEVSHNVLLFSFSVFRLSTLLIVPCVFADFYLNSLSQLHSAEMQEQLLSCLSSEPYSNWEPWDKKVTHHFFLFYHLVL